MIRLSPTSTLFPYTTLFRSNLGLRWDGVPHTYEANNRMGNFYPSLYNAANAATFDSTAHICSGPTDPGCTAARDRKSTRLNSSHLGISYAVFCLKKKKN